MATETSCLIKNQTIDQSPKKEDYTRETETYLFSADRAVNTLALGYINQSPNKLYTWKKILFFSGYP
jgi:hypothetical protein